MDRLARLLAKDSGKYGDSVKESKAISQMTASKKADEIKVYIVERRKVECKRIRLLSGMILEKRSVLVEK